MDSSSEHSEKRPHPGSVAVNVTDLAHSNVTLDPEVAANSVPSRRKIDWYLMPLMMTFADKTTLGQAAVLGLQQGAHLTQNQFNWLGSIFYFSYLLFEYPQNLALQRFPVGKWMAINIFVWAIALMAHAACKSFGALFAVRFILGLCEVLMNGFAVIFLGFVAFGVLHTKTPNFMPWQWLMIITGAITLVTSVLFWFFFPDSPTTARFLTVEERIPCCIENKHWKRPQFMATIKDPKIWLLAAFAALSFVLIVQRQIIVKQFGFNPIQTTLLGCVDGVVEILTIWAGVTIAGFKPIGRAYAGSSCSSPLSLAPSVGLLFSYWLTSAPFSLLFSRSRRFAISLGWLSSLTAGHTRRTTANAIILVAYGLGNAVGPFMWKKQYQPRNHIPWAIITACSTRTTMTEYYIQEVQADGTTLEKKVDREFLDLTDVENKEFRYVL
ncbi:major facilitator superfamily domain-containing protein [Mycena olivaceomarginata]|nr:major facilitator superfamily domain-containing protein [Mycena olivaceomarginata]